MQFKSLSIAKALLALSTVIGLTSAYFGQQWSQEVVALNGTVAKTKSQLKEAQDAQLALAKSQRPDSARVSLDAAVSATMLEVFNQRVAHEVTIAYATPAKLSAGGSVSKLDSLSEDVPGTSIKSVRINVSGSYATYQGLLGYLKSLEALPVAIVRLKVQDQSFEVGLRVYGNEV